MQAARDNLRSGNLGVLPVVLGEFAIVVYFALTATNFFTASNFVNVILQMAGVTMIAYGVVFVLLLGEIDLSVAYVSGIAAVAVAEFQLPGSSHDFPGWLAILARARDRRRDRARPGHGRRKGRGAVVRRHARRPAHLAGGDPQDLQVRDTIIIEDNWVNYAATYYFSANVGWLIAAAITAALRGRGSRRDRRPAPGGPALRPGMAIAKLVGVAVASFGTVAICNHAKRPTACPEGTPLTESCTSRSACRSQGC